MTIDRNHFWDLLSQSRLIDASRIEVLYGEFISHNSRESGSNDANESSEQNPKAIAKWLVGKKVLSSYQAKIILAGHSGPFVYGNYEIIDQLKEGPLKSSFLGLHRKTRHSVLIQFFGGTDSRELEEWNQLEALVSRLKKIDHPHVAQFHEAVRLPSHRFVISQKPIGQVLSTALPKKARLPWQDAIRMISQIADGLTQIHEQGIVHNSISPRTIWLPNSKFAQLRMSVLPDPGFEKVSDTSPECRDDYCAPELFTDPSKMTFKSDLYALGCVLVRCISGRTVFEEPDPVVKKKLHLKQSPLPLVKYKISDSAQNLIDRLLAKKPENRPESAQKVAAELREIIGESESKRLKLAPAPTLESYQKWLTGWAPLPAPKAPATPIKLDVVEEQLTKSTTTTAERIELAKRARGKSKWFIPAAVLTSLLIMSGIIGVLAWQANQTVMNEPVLKTPPTPNENEIKERSSETKAEIPKVQPMLAQELIPDDGIKLWESPTCGRRINFGFVPLNPKFMFIIKPNQLLSMKEGTRLLSSLGPSSEKLLAAWNQRSGIPLSRVKQLTISLHSNDQFEYDSFFVVELNEPIEESELVAGWRGPTIDESNAVMPVYVADNISYAITQKTDQGVSGFLAGPTELLNAVVERGGLPALSGPMKRLATRTDIDRHFTMMFLRPALFNDEGQKLMAGTMSEFNRKLRLLLPDELSGGMLSLHLDNGSYLEFMLDHTVDMKPREMKDYFETRLRNQRDQLSQFVASLPPNPYWDKVRLRYGTMITDFYRNLRMDVEYGEVYGNCWLPPMAAHNLIAASELAMTYSSGSTSSVPISQTYKKKIPTTIEELLGQPRSLKVTTNPDLNILLEGLRDEIMDDYGSLPFDFQIILLGNDLVKDGITKNQRPGDFEMDEKPLSEILTQIVVRCNPDKDISGPADPNCKLIWVVAENPDKAGEKAVLITTRTGAATKSYSLPAAFSEE